MPPALILKSMNPFKTTEIQWDAILKQLGFLHIFRIIDLLKNKEKCNTRQIFNPYAFIVLHLNCWTSLCFELFGWTNEPNNMTLGVKSFSVQRWHLRMCFQEKGSRSCLVSVCAEAGQEHQISVCDCWYSGCVWTCSPDGLISLQSVS